MGEVWRAEHRLLARPSAIKLIRPSFAMTHSAEGTAEAMRRFEREAQVTAQLRSPHTVNLFDFGVADDGSFYYVMEFLEGVDVETLVERFGPVPAERAIFILRQICHSLSEAQSRGLVHRDIKPANIFLCRYGEDYDFVKVLDFGIVKAVKDFANTTLHVTLDHILQACRLTSHPSRHWAPDRRPHRHLRYRLRGVLLLTGRRCSPATRRLPSSCDHIQTPPVPPSLRSEMPIPAAPDALGIVLLAKDPADRPQTAKDLWHRLDEVRVTDP